MAYKKNQNNCTIFPFWILRVKQEFCVSLAWAQKQVGENLAFGKKNS